MTDERQNRPGRLKCPNGHVIGKIAADGSLTSRRHQREIHVVPPPGERIFVSIRCEHCGAVVEKWLQKPSETPENRQ